MVFGFRAIRGMCVRLPASRWIHTVSHSSTVMCYSILFVRTVTITTYCCVCVDRVMELVVSSQVIKHTINKYSITVTIRSISSCSHQFRRNMSSSSNVMPLLITSQHLSPEVTANTPTLNLVCIIANIQYACVPRAKLPL